MDKSRFMITKIFTVVMLLFVTLACSQKPEELLLGKWKNKYFEYEFLKDGTLNHATMNVNIGGTNRPPPAPSLESGKWSRQGDNKVKLSRLHDGKEQKPYFWIISFPDNDTLITTVVTSDNANGPIQTYTRVSGPK